MTSFLKSVVFLLFIQVSIFAKEIQTFYGPIDVNEPVLIELIECPAFQRLKSIHQYGVSYYTTHKEEYTRYEHSLGVFTILRKKGCSLEEQIAGLLHDVSHTVFSHVGDWIFSKDDQEEDYQTSIHKHYLEASGISAILEKYGLTPDQVLAKEELFPALEQPGPSLCADRIDYNIQGAYYQGFITHDEAIEILHDLQFKDRHWIATRQDLMAKLVRYSIFMTQDCWGSACNYLHSRWLADAIIRARDIGEITNKEIHFSTDQAIWNKLMASEDPFIQEKMKKVLGARQLHTLVDDESYDLKIMSKFRGIDPWILKGDQKERITSIDPALAEEYNAAKERMNKGWHIKLLTPL